MLESVARITQSWVPSMRSTESPWRRRVTDEIRSRAGDAADAWRDIGGRAARAYTQSNCALGGTRLTQCSCRPYSYSPLRVGRERAAKSASTAVARRNWIVRKGGILVA